MAAAAPRNWLILQYSYVPDMETKRVPFRERHLAAFQKQADAGKLVLAGAHSNPIEGGLIIYKDSTEEEVNAYAKADIYNENGLITGWTVKTWVVGIVGEF